MPRRTVRLTRRSTTRGRGVRKVVRQSRGSTRTSRKTRRLRNGHHLRKWMSHRAKPWMVSGRGFWQDFGRGFSSVFKPFATVGGPILDALGMPEFGVPLSAVGSLM